MKKIFFTSVLAFAGLSLTAQNLEKVKTMLKDNKIEAAKNEIDKIAATEKWQKNPDVFYTKAKVYAAISDNEAEYAKVPDAREQSYEALKKYIAMDNKQYVSLQLDQFQPLTSIYHGYYKDGTVNFNEKDFKGAYNNFLKAGDVSQLMVEKGWSTVPFDTTVILYTAVAAQNAKMGPEAAKYYTILTNARVNGEGMEDCYKWLADYYSREEKIDSAQKYLALGRELFPEDTWWTSMELDMIREKGDKDALFNMYERAVKESPDKMEYSYNYALELYDYAYHSDVTKRPTNSAELINKVESLLKRTLELQPENHQALLVLAQVLYNQGVDIQNEAVNIKGSKPEDVKKRADMKEEAIANYDKAIPYLEEIVTKLENKAELAREEKSSLRNALDILITIYDQKNAKDKMKVFEDKYNKLDKN